MDEAMSETKSASAPDIPAHRYTAAMAAEIEARWQSEWETSRTFASPNPGEEGFDPSKNKQSVLDRFSCRFPGKSVNIDCAHFTAHQAARDRERPAKNAYKRSNSSLFSKSNLQKTDIGSIPFLSAHDLCGERKTHN